jgi:hypothetical protein
MIAVVLEITPHKDDEIMPSKMKELIRNIFLYCDKEASEEGLPIHLNTTTE